MKVVAQMSRKTIYVLKDTGESDSVKTSIHGSQYNADAASPEVYKMGPSHITIRALRLIEATCDTRKVALFPISEVKGKDRSAVVSTPSKKADNTCSEIFNSIEHDRRKVQRETQHLNELIQHWLKDSKTGSQEARAERYQTAVRLQEELRRSMHITRKLRNECKALIYTDDFVKTNRRAIMMTDIQSAECRLEEIAAAIEELQNLVDVERRKVLRLVEESDMNRARRSRASR